MTNFTYEEFKTEMGRCCRYDIRGTEKQVDWATDIRKKYFRAVDEIANEIIDAGEPASPFMWWALQSGSCLSAKKWIENRAKMTRTEIKAAWEAIRNGATADLLF